MKNETIKLTEKDINKIVTESTKKILKEWDNEEFHGIDRNKVYTCSTLDDVKKIAFKTMINEENYENGEFIAYFMFNGFSFRIYKLNDGTNALTYHKETTFGDETKYFMTVGGVWYFIFNELLKLNIYTIR